MNAGLVEFRQQQQKPVNVHRPRSFFHKIAVVQNSDDFFLDGEIFRQRDFLRFAMNAIVFLEDAQNGVGLETGAESLVFPRERDACERVPLLEVDWRRGISRLDADDG